MRGDLGKPEGYQAGPGEACGVSGGKIYYPLYLYEAKWSWNDDRRSTWRMLTLKRDVDGTTICQLINRFGRMN